MVTPSIEFSPTGESWFETHVGKSARDIVKELKKVRRTLKSSKSEIDAAIDQLATSQRLIFESLLKLQKESPDSSIINACTDITGFGLLGHLEEMLLNSNNKIKYSV